MPRKTLWDILDEDFIKYVEDSNTYADLLRKCGYKNIGNRDTIKKRIKLLNLSVEHFGKFQPKRKQYNKNRINIENILIENSTYSRRHLKKRLLDELKWEYKCNNCGINEWMGKKISLELEHKNGVSNDNRIENLEFLCTNCNSQTDTFRGRNNKGKRTCKICKIKILTGWEKQSYCDKCMPKCKECQKEINDKNKTGFCQKCK